MLLFNGYKKWLTSFVCQMTRTIRWGSLAPSPNDLHNLWSRTNDHWSRYMEHHLFESNGRSNCSFLEFQAKWDPYNIRGINFCRPTNQLFVQLIQVHDCSRNSFYHGIGTPLGLYDTKQNNNKSISLKTISIVLFNT